MADYNLGTATGTIQINYAGQGAQQRSEEHTS